MTGSRCIERDNHDASRSSTLFTCLNAALLAYWIRLGERGPAGRSSDQDRHHRHGELVGIPYAANDPGATKLAGQLIKDAGFDPVYVGDLSRAKEFDFGSKVYVRLLTAAQLRTELGLK